MSIPSTTELEEKLWRLLQAMPLYRPTYSGPPSCPREVRWRQQWEEKHVVVDDPGRPDGS